MTWQIKEPLLSAYLQLSSGFKVLERLLLTIPMSAFAADSDDDEEVVPAMQSKGFSSADILFQSELSVDSPTSTYTPLSANRKTLSNKASPARVLRFEHFSLTCMAVSIVALAGFVGGMISAQTELRVEIVSLCFKTCCELYFNKWGVDLLIHHSVMGGAFGLLQFTEFQRWAFVCVYMQLVHVPLCLKHLWTVFRHSGFKRTRVVLHTRCCRLLHTLFWPCWLFVVCFRTPFLLRASQHAVLASSPTAGAIIFIFAACVFYLDALWTVEVAMSKTHGVVGAAVTEPEGWPAGLRNVRFWALSPCFAGIAAAVMPPMERFWKETAL